MSMRIQPSKQKQKVELNEYLLPNTMRSCEHILLGEERGSAVELSVVHDPGHPRVPVGAGRHPAHDAVLLVRAATL